MNKEQFASLIESLNADSDALKARHEAMWATFKAAIRTGGLHAPTYRTMLTEVKAAQHSIDDLVDTLKKDNPELV